MDVAIADGAPSPGVWLAVTSISFDISVLELLWTLARGFCVVIAPEADRASMERRGVVARRPAKPMEFGLFYFAADAGSIAAGEAYRLLIEGAKFADTHGFAAVWTPERHFHAFGGLYPNPAITTAALATITKRVHLRAGSIVLPLHNPLRVAEDWAVIDQLSGGRVGLSVASGWHVNDFAFMPGNYERRREVMLENLDLVLRLWRGEAVSVSNGAGAAIAVSTLPRPVQERPPVWIAAAGSPETFALAGRLGANILTNMLGQDISDLKAKFAAYRAARKASGHTGDGTVSVMLHTFVCADTEEARRLARKPLSSYLASSIDLVKVAPTMFPAFRQPSRESSAAVAVESPSFTPEDVAALVDHAFDRYFESSGLFGTPEHAMTMVDRLQEIGATEVACLIDFGIDPDIVLSNLPHLHRLQELCRQRASGPAASSAGTAAVDDTVPALIRRHGVTHLQCTPSMARALASDSVSLASLGSLKRLMIGGEAFPADLATRLTKAVSGRVLNMYGPTETTIWSTTAEVVPAEVPTIGRPIANTTIRILDEQRQLVPIGTPGELHIGGYGVARGYLGRPDLTSERFIQDPWNHDGRLYRTGDIARFRPDGNIEFLGRVDHQVKVNGYRIELGDIEAALGRHSSVRQCVVTAQQSDRTDGSALVAYVVREASARAKGAGAARVNDWQKIWDETYTRGLASSEEEPRFRISGWSDSYGGEPIPPDEMKAWLDHAVERIRALRPKRVLELGCGTGMILYRLLGDVDHYTGVDLSAAALESIKRELTGAERAKVTLGQYAATDLDHITQQSFDLVIINSVAQYFPDAEYLVDVLRRATGLVREGGQIFVGDVRSLAHLQMFHASVALHQVADGTSADEMLQAVEKRRLQESELVLAEEFFHAVVSQVPRLTKADVQLKRGRAHNELSRFRYDVVLHVGVPENPVSRVDPVHVTSLKEVEASVERGAPAILLRDVPNARVSGIAAMSKALTSAPGGAHELREMQEREKNRGVDPETLYTFHPSYEVDVRWARSGNAANIDALFRLKGAVSSNLVYEPPPCSDRPSDYANIAGAGIDVGATVKELRNHLLSQLPAYMVPSAIVILDDLPLTANGKIDRKALPAPQQQAVSGSPVYSPPRSVLEEQIGAIWQELLSVSRVSRQDNIFDLGANSLLTMQANSRLSALLNRRVPLVSMFRFPTIAALAAHLDEGVVGSEAIAVEQRKQERSSRAENAASRRRALRAGRTDT